MRRYRIDHATTYSYSDVVSSSYGRGYLAPREMPGQRCRSHRLVVDPEPADTSSGCDVYGNVMSYFHVTTEHQTLTVRGESVVEVDETPLRLPSTPWELCAPTGTAVEFRLDLDPPEIDDVVKAYAEQSFSPGRPLGEAVAELTGRIYADFTYRSGSTTVSTRVADVLGAREGVCQDFARVAIACLRSQGLAARYVSGYLATDPPPGKERMVGADATHAWAAVWTGSDWLAFDPTNNQFADERYVTVAWGRDYVDVAPLRGIIYTDSKASTITVSVDVLPI